MAKAIRSFYEKVKKFLNGQISRKAAIVPYLLMGVLFYLLGLSNEQAREQDLKTAEILAAQVEYQNTVDTYYGKLAIRKDCIEDVNGRNNNIMNWHKLYDFISSLSEKGAMYAASLKADFDARNPAKSIEEDCKRYPEPEFPVIPPILIEEGIIHVD